jgi:large subunit ribosomal protein L35
MAKKYKLKTNKAVKKRFKKTATGKVKRAKAGRRHLLADKSGKKKRAMRQSGLVSASDLKRLKRLLINI